MYIVGYIADPQYIIWQRVKRVEKTVGGSTHNPPSPAIQTLSMGKQHCIRSENSLSLMATCLL